ncbi:hypothetical protein E6P78_27910 [Streptomyces sp. A0958]|uniref:hypothetical protein n=1 Tax=Streptomyces sp. A0958 TaxID=2563101 RepID=UPI00109EC937|nr:hypothetical protein [Streptomyces sp. A0958]THA60168.1 hypothetical protein E6P78_27910 [Streptomyces sp. A0958]
MSRTTEEAGIGAAPPAVLRTPALRRCVEVAQALAHGEGGPVDVLHLFLSVACDSEADTRSRLVMRATAWHHFFTDETYREVAEGAGRTDARTRAVPFAPAAAAVLSRLAYWTTRTGDETADTAHLLLACLETGTDDKEMRKAIRTLGLSGRVALSQAMTVRREVAAADRQLNHRGPILSRSRRDRPTPYHFQAPHRAIGPRKGRAISLRSQMTSAAHVSSHLQSHLIRLHVWVGWWHQLGIFAALSVTIWASLTVTPWSALWLISVSIRRHVASPGPRLGCDAALVVASAFLGIPWLLVATALVCRLIDLLDGRLALLQIRGDVGDPALTESALQSDRRADRRAAHFYRTLKFRRRLTPE